MNNEWVFGIIFLFLFVCHSYAQPEMRMVPCSSGATCKKITIFHETNTDLHNFNYNSLNLEYLLSCSPTNAIGLRVGFIYYNFPKISANGAPVEMNFLFGRSYNLVDIGFGATYLDVTENYNNTIGRYKEYISYAGLNAHVGFRHQVTEGGLFYRVGFVPMLSVLNYKEIPIIADKIFITMFAVAIGWTFK